VVGFSEDSERLLRLIEFCEKYESIHSNTSWQTGMAHFRRTWTTFFFAALIERLSC
jgi:hypothetical protein